MSKQRAKGTAWETAFVNYLVECGIQANRTGFSSAHGDVETPGFPVLCWEGKNVERQELGAWLAQATRSANRTLRWPVVFHKRRGHSVADAYVTMPAWVMVRILQAWGCFLVPSAFKVDL